MTWEGGTKGSFGQEIPPRCPQNTVSVPKTQQVSLAGTVLLEEQPGRSCKERPQKHSKFKAINLKFLHL